MNKNIFLLILCLFSFSCTNYETYPASTAWCTYDERQGLIDFKFSNRNISVKNDAQEEVSIQWNDGDPANYTQSRIGNGLYYSASEELLLGGDGAYLDNSQELKLSIYYEPENNSSVFHLSGFRNQLELTSEYLPFRWEAESETAYSSHSEINCGSWESIPQSFYNPGYNAHPQKRRCEVEVSLDQIFRKPEGRSNGPGTQTLHLEGTATLTFIEYHLDAGSNCNY